ncbi:MAG: hypothetical protein BZY81_08360 [SAR202 cluster bacterium Io17-Chloro-G4]|nr:MAG: hypothetical protein BZY81_08360 [SAR202 cluster bacterium Io17-Chloro-G4]
MFTQKKRWIIVSLIVGLLTIGITAGVAMGHGGGEDRESALNNFASRVATILGLQESKVQDAFTQAKEETRAANQAAKEARLQDKLNQLVEDGSITQEQADQYMEWLQSRPEGLRSLRGIRGIRGHGSIGEHRFGGDLFGGSRFDGRLFGQDSGSESRSFKRAPQELFSGIDQTITY